MPRTVTTILTLKDRMSGEMKKISSLSNKTAQGMQKKFTLAGRKVEKTGQKIAGVGKSLTLGVTVPLVGAATVATNKYADVDKTMALVNSTMKNSEEEAAMLSQAMKDAASNSTFGMSEAAEAALNFARAGWDAEQTAYALAPAMALAAGEGGDLDTVSAGLMATMNSFGAKAGEASKYADIFANACNNSALDVNSLADSMSVAAPIFKTSGQDVTDAALAMGVMANAGTDANVAANALKTGIARLASPAKAGAEWMKKLGISAFDSDGKLKDMTVLQSELSKAFSGLTSEEKEAAAGAIFGKNQMAPWLSLIQTAPKDVEKLSKKLEEEGTAARMSEDMMSGFGGSLEKLKSAFDVLATTLGETLAPYIQVAVDKLQALTDKFNALSPQQKDMIVKIGMIVAAIGPALLIVGKVVSIVGIVIAKIGTVISVVMKVISAIKAVIVVIGIVTGLPAIAVAAIAAAVIAAIVLIVKFRKQIAAFFVNIWNKLKEFAGNVKTKFTEIVDAVKGKIEDIKDKILEFKDKVKGWFTEIGENIKSALLAPFEWISEKIEGFKSGVSGLVESAKEKAAGVKEKITGNALGTNYWRGGETLVGEHGPEMVSLPAGSKIYSNPKTQSMGQKSPTINLNLTIQGNVIGNEEYATMLSDKISDKLMVALAN